MSILNYYIQYRAAILKYLYQLIYFMLENTKILKGSEI